MLLRRARVGQVNHARRYSRKDPVHRPHGQRGFVAGGFGGAVLFCVVDLFLRLTPHEPPFQWIEPRMRAGLACAVLGALVGSLLAVYHLRAAARRPTVEPTAEMRRSLE